MDNRSEREKQISQLKETVAKWDIIFKFTPSTELCEDITKNEHPYIKGLPTDYKAIFLQKEPVAVATKMVLDYVDKKLDASNTYILDRGTISSTDNNIIILKEKH